jgi:hypothetical protein
LLGVRDEFVLPQQVDTWGGDYPAYVSIIENVQTDPGISDASN